MELTLEPWRLTSAHGAHPGAMEAHLDPWSTPSSRGDHPRAMEVHPGAMQLTLEPWRLTLELWSLPWNHGKIYFSDITYFVIFFCILHTVNLPN
jgi:hypothetical protein